MAITEAYTNSATIGTTEYSLPNNSTTPASISDAGVYQVFLDLNNLVAGDQFEIRIKEKATSGGTQRLAFLSVVEYIQSSPIWVSPSLILMNGWDVTITKTAGTDRSISWSIRKVA